MCHQHWDQNTPPLPGWALWGELKSRPAGVCTHRCPHPAESCLWNADVQWPGERQWLSTQAGEPRARVPPSGPLAFCFVLSPVLPSQHLRALAALGVGYDLNDQGTRGLLAVCRAGVSQRAVRGAPPLVVAGGHLRSSGFSSGRGTPRVHSSNQTLGMSSAGFGQPFLLEETSLRPQASGP